MSSQSLGYPVVRQPFLDHSERTDRSDASNTSNNLLLTPSVEKGNYTDKIIQKLSLKMSKCTPLLP